MDIKVRRAVLEDAKSLAHIIVESWKSAYEDLIPKDEITRFLDKERRQEQFERFIKEDEIVLIGFYEKSGFKFDGSKKHSHFSNKPIEMRYRMKI